MVQLSDLTSKLYRHPMAVSVEVQRIEKNVAKILNKTHQIVHDSDYDSMAYESIESLEEETNESFNLLYERFLGEKRRVERARNAFNDWKPIRDNYIRITLESGFEAGETYAKQFEQPVLQDLYEAMNYLSGFAKNKGVEFYTNASATRTNSIRKSIILLVWVFAVVILLVKFIADKISRPLLLLNENMRNISRGRADLTARLNLVAKDEIGELSRNFDGFIEKLQTLAYSVKGGENIDSEKNLILSKVMDNLLTGKNNDAYLDELEDLIKKFKKNSGRFNLDDDKI